MLICRCEKHTSLDSLLMDLKLLIGHSSEQEISYFHYKKYVGEFRRLNSPLMPKLGLKLELEDCITKFKEIDP